MLLSLVLAAAPMVDLSPYAVKPLPDGAREYSYDLAGVKAGPSLLAASAVAALIAAGMSLLRLRSPRTVHRHAEEGATILD